MLSSTIEYEYKCKLLVNLCGGGDFYTELENLLHLSLLQSNNIIELNYNSFNAMQCVQLDNCQSIIRTSELLSDPFQDR